MIEDFFKPYIEAVKKIFHGTPVKELDDIRKQCNEAFHKAASLRERRQTQGYLGGYYPELIFLTFAADAENKILLGMDPVQAYSIAKGPVSSLEFREIARVIMENTIKEYLK